VLDTGQPLLDVPLEGETPARPGERRAWVEQFYPLRDATGAVVGVNVVCEEVTEKKRAAEALRAAEEQLHRSHDTFYHLIQNNPFGIYIVDADFRLRQVSLGAQRVFNHVKPLLQRDFAEVLRAIWEEPFASEAIGRFRHTLATGEPYIAQSTIERRRDIPAVEAYDWRIERITLPDGRYGVVCYFYDLSERRQWEEALRLREEDLRTLTDNTPDILTRFDRDLRHIFVNAAVERATGRPREAFHGKSNREMGMPDRLCDVWDATLREVFAKREPRNIEFTFDTPTGLRYYAGCLVPEFGPGGEVVSVLGVTRDRTAERIAEEALRDANRRKDEFLATLAHELRNPLAPVRNGLQALRLAPAGSDMAVRVRDMMERQLQHMVRLIDDLLDVSRISSGKLELRRERVLVQSVVESAVEASRPLIEQGRYELRLRLPEGALFLDADPTRLAQVVSNLLNNSAKYTQDGGRIELSAEPSGTQLIIQVTDNGAGIPRDMLPKVFDLFTQVGHTLDRAQGGLGIGLSLARRLVEMHGGTIEAESPGPGHGSTFTLRLPCAAAAADLADRPQGSPPEERARGAARPRHRRQRGRGREPVPGAGALRTPDPDRAQRTRRAGRGARLPAAGRVLRHRNARHERLRGCEGTARRSLRGPRDPRGPHRVGE
jgi:PAS domain S-box-containing protein